MSPFIWLENSGSSISSHTATHSSFGQKWNIYDRSSFFPVDSRWPMPINGQLPFAALVHKGVPPIFANPKIFPSLIFLFFCWHHFKKLCRFCSGDNFLSQVKSSVASDWVESRVTDCTWTEKWHRWRGTWRQRWRQWPWSLLQLVRKIEFWPALDSDAVCMSLIIVGGGWSACLHGASDEKCQWERERERESARERIIGFDGRWMCRKLSFKGKIDFLYSWQAGYGGWVGKVWFNLGVCLWQDRSWVNQACRKYSK